MNLAMSLLCYFFNWVPLVSSISHQVLIFLLFSCLLSIGFFCFSFLFISYQDLIFCFCFLCSSGIRVPTSIRIMSGIIIAPGERSFFFNFQTLISKDTIFAEDDETILSSI